MELRTKEKVIKSVPYRWKQQYPNSKQDIYDKLINTQNLTEEKIFDIIGNKSWTRIECDQCSREVDQVIILGQELEYESHTASICFDCLDKAYKLKLEYTLLKA